MGAGVGSTGDGVGSTGAGVLQRKKSGETILHSCRTSIDKERGLTDLQAQASDQLAQELGPQATVLDRPELESDLQVQASCMKGEK